VLLVFGVLFTVVPAFAEDRMTMAFGDPFPELSLPAFTSTADRSYLGLDDEAGFTPSQIKADVLLVELLNVHCSHCQKQTPSYSELFRLIEADPATKGRVKMLGIAVGNLPQEVKSFRERYPVPFPVIPDQRFTAHRALGASATPFTLYVRQDQTGQPGVIAKTHLGLNPDYRKVFAELKQLLSSKPAELRRQRSQAARTRTAITPLYSETELETVVRRAFTKTGGGIREFTEVSLPSGRRVYSALMRKGQQERLLFAEVTSRQSVCDVCHDVHFIYLFDTAARIVGFEPLQVTKYGNVLWSEAEAEKMRQRVVGQYLTAPRPFDPQVDAVTSATISSAIIFDSIAQGEALLGELRDKGY
jgi:peroxiredoxin